MKDRDDMPSRKARKGKRMIGKSAGEEPMPPKRKKRSRGGMPPIARVVGRPGRPADSDSDSDYA